jgi:hypothetical protein
VWEVTYDGNKLENVLTDVADHSRVILRLEGRIERDHSLTVIELAKSCSDGGCRRREKAERNGGIKIFHLQLD